MRHPLTFALVWLITLTAFGQTKRQSVQRPVLIGVDIAKPVLSLISPYRTAFRLGEVTVKVPIAGNRYLSVVAGYGQARSDTIYRNIRMKLSGPYLKIGTERLMSSGLLVGWHGMTALTQETATYSYRGPTFGDYVVTAFDRQRVVVGMEGFFGYQQTLSDRLIFRVSGRATVAGLFGTRSKNEPAVLFVPGVGVALGDPVAVGFGLGLHVFYRTNPRPVAVSQP
ncbi:MAG: hypothetical protein H7319_08860 [Spirosoma sp.]|nr:hypothetical protein [Spirosoma sp.]